VEKAQVADNREGFRDLQLLFSRFSRKKIKIKLTKMT